MVWFALIWLGSGLGLPWSGLCLGHFCLAWVCYFSGLICSGLGLVCSSLDWVWFVLVWACFVPVWVWLWCGLVSNGSESVYSGLGQFNLVRSGSGVFWPGQGPFILVWVSLFWSGLGLVCSGLAWVFILLCYGSVCSGLVCFGLDWVHLF